MAYQEAVGKVERDELFEEIFTDLKGVVKGVARKWDNSLPMDRDDIESELVIVLFRVLEDFNIEDGNKVSTLCNTYFTNKLNNIYNKFNTQKRSNKHGDDYSMEMVMDSNDIELGAELAESLSFTVDDYREAELMCFLDELGLEVKERTVCELFANGFTNKSEIARQIGISPAGLSYMIKRIKEKMKTNIVFAY